MIPIITTPAKSLNENTFDQRNVTTDVPDTTTDSFKSNSLKSRESIHNPLLSPYYEGSSPIFSVINNYNNRMPFIRNDGPMFHVSIAEDLYALEESACHPGFGSIYKNDHVPPQPMERISSVSVHIQMLKKSFGSLSKDETSEFLGIINQTCIIPPDFVDSIWLHRKKNLFNNSCNETTKQRKNRSKSEATIQTNTEKQEPEKKKKARKQKSISFPLISFALTPQKKSRKSSSFRSLPSVDSISNNRPESPPLAAITLPSLPSLIENMDFIDDLDEWPEEKCEDDEVVTSDDPDAEKTPLNHPLPISSKNTTYLKEESKSSDRRRAIGGLVTSSPVTLGYDFQE